MTSADLDVLVIGFGAAGASAAIAAHDAGARVGVIEKTGAGGGNCRHSGGFLFEIDDEVAIEHLDALCFGKTDRSVLTAYATGLHDVRNFLESLGGDVETVRIEEFGGLLPSWPHFPGAGRVRYHRYAGSHAPPGHALWELLERSVLYLPRHANRPRLPGQLIFDEAARLAGPLNGIVGTPDEYPWSHDNRTEVERGWIKRGETAHETLVRLEPPLYAIEMWPGVATASGGPRRDSRARVLRAGGAPIDGLYAAGAAGSIWGHLTEHGGGLTDAIVFGGIAGEEAAGRAGAPESASTGHETRKDYNA